MLLSVLLSLFAYTPGGFIPHTHRWQRPQLVWPLYVKQASVKKNTSQASYRPLILKNFLSYGVIFLDNLRVYQIYETNKQTNKKKQKS